MTDEAQQRTVAYVVWGALLAGVLIFAGVAGFIGPQVRQGARVLPPSLDLAPVVLALGLVAASRAVPFLMGPQAPPLARHLVATALCEGAGIVAVVFWMLTGHPYAVAGLAVGVGGILACFPGDGRWRALSTASGAGGGPPDSDRSSGPGIGERGSPRR